MNTPQVSQTVLDTHFGVFDFYCFSWGSHEEDNILAEVRTPIPSPALVRVQSACYTAEIFRSRDCDCHEQLEQSLSRIQLEGGVFVYILADGRGAGLYTKVLGLELGRTRGLDTADAYSELGIPADARSYARVGWILRDLGLKEIRLLTNNPRKLLGLKEQGFQVIREPLEIPPTPQSRHYLEAKKRKLGHLLDSLD